MFSIGTGPDLSINQQEPQVVFVVTVRNNARLLNSCLRSVARQTYNARKCIVVDDASTDDTLLAAQRWADERPDLFLVRSDGARRGKLANFADVIADLNDHDVVVELDGDDCLLVTDAAADLARLHMRLDLVWTQHRVARRSWPSWIHWRSTDVPANWRESIDIPRLAWSRGWYPGHLRTCKAWAFRRIDPADLKNSGRWLMAAADMAYYAPLVEMTPPSLRYFYDRELAIYNITENNDHFRDSEALSSLESQSHCAEELSRRPAYRTRPAPLWLGVLRPPTREAIMKVWIDQTTKDPATRFLLVSPLPLPDSWHPRVQVVAQPAMLATDQDEAANDVRTLEWLANTFLISLDSDQCRRPVPNLPLVEVVS